jgi:hypothetical protein
MAQFDNSMYRGVPAVDFSQAADGFERGMRLGDMMKENRKKAAIEDAYKSSMVQGTDGQSSFDPSLASRKLGELGFQKEAQEMQAQQMQQQKQKMAFDAEKQMFEAEEIAKATYGVKDPGSYGAALNYLQSKGIDVSTAPKEFNPQFVADAQQKAISALDRMKLQMQQENMALTREDQKLDRAYKIANMQQSRLDRQDALNLKKQEKEDKKGAAVVEIQDRYLNIKDQIKALQGQIDQYGTFETVGPQNEIMDQKITSIATDMAKLVDPTSVARESEVAAFKKMLFEPSLWMRNSTAKGVLNAFDQMVDQRLETAYKVRGLDKNENVTNKTQAPEQSKPKWAK